MSANLRLVRLMKDVPTLGTLNPVTDASTGAEDLSRLQVALIPALVVAPCVVMIGYWTTLRLLSGLTLRLVQQVGSGSRTASVTSRILSDLPEK
jgi:hypothetical protein